MVIPAKLVKHPKRLARALRVPEPVAAQVLRAVQNLCVARGGQSPSYQLVEQTLTAALGCQVSEDGSGSVKPKNIGVRTTYADSGEPVKMGKKGEGSGKRDRSARLILESRRGTTIYVSGRKCSVCKSHRRLLTRYSKSNWGVVVLCEGCKDEVFKRSYGSVDAASVFVESRRLHHDHEDGKREGMRR